MHLTRPLAGLRAPLMALVLALGLPTIIVVGASPAAAATCDEVLIAGSSWLGGQGVDVRSNGPYTGTEDSCRGYVTNLSANPPQSGYGWQCPELVNRLYRTRGWISETWTGNGADMYGTAPGHLAKEPQGSITRLTPGDVVVFGTNFFSGFGHVGVVGTMSGNSGTLYSQNTTNASWSLSFSGGSVTFPGVASADKVIGVVHAPGVGGQSDESRLAGDFDGDGRTDLAVVTQRGGGGSNVTVLTSHGASLEYGGAWYADDNLPFAGLKVVSGDFNGDRRADLVAGTLRAGGGTNLTVLLSTGTSLQYGGAWYTDDSLPFAGSKVVGGDFDGDRDTDLAFATVRGGGGTNVTVLKSNGATFAYGGPWYSDDNLPFAGLKMVSGDLNGDRRRDLAMVTVRTGGGTNVTVLTSNGAALQYGGAWYADDNLPFAGSKLVTGDFNGDRKTDLAVSTVRTGGGTNVTVLTSNGAALQYGGAWYADDNLPFVSSRVVSGDLNRDRRTDLAVITLRTGGGTNVTVLTSTGAALQYGGAWYADDGLPFGTALFGGDLTNDIPGGEVVDPSAADFDGNGTTDISVLRPSANTWYLRNGATVHFGVSGDIPVPCDYDGNGTADIAVFRPSVGGWLINGQTTVFLGASEDVPVPGDYDGDGDCDPAVFRPSVGGWYRVGQATVFHGLDGDIPVPADYDRDGTADIAVFRPSVGGWYRATQPTIFFGLNSDVPVPTDYDGDGAADLAVFRPSVGGWYVSGLTTQFLGLTGDIPVPGDYDGDGTADRAVFRPGTGAWYVGNELPAYFGLHGDRPLPLPSAIGQALPT